ncbi:DJ-1/PfpI family protein [Candidatus Peregrinibacteria bacterium]|nr:DJ-1/PfpI family protein [Candidatus Peregrinibacteria bacterium]
MSNILSVIGAKGYQDKEYGDSKDALERHGHTVTTASTADIAHGKFGGTFEVDTLLNEVNPDDYAAILFVGGQGCFPYFDDPVAHGLAQAFYGSGKVTAAICAASAILANAGVLKGKKATCWEGVAEILTAKGADYTGKDVERDGLIVTATGPATAAQFGEMIHKALTGI